MFPFRECLMSLEIFQREFGYHVWDRDSMAIVNKYRYKICRSLAMADHCIQSVSLFVGANLCPELYPWGSAFFSLLVQKCVHFPPAAPLASFSWRVTSGSCWGHVCAPFFRLFPPLRGISLTPSLGQEPRLLGFPPASWCRAALQASRESLSWFPSSCAGRAFSQGLEVSGVPGGIGVEAL